MKRIIPGSAAALAVALGGTFLALSPASAASPCSGVGQTIPGGGGAKWNGCVDAGAGLNARRHAGLGSISYGTDPGVYTYPAGTKVQIDCYLPGPSVTGYDGASTTIWDSVLSYQLPGSSTVYTWADSPYAFFSSDAWIYTGTDSAVVPKCNGNN